MQNRRTVSSHVFAGRQLIADGDSRAVSHWRAHVPLENLTQEIRPNNALLPVPLPANSLGEP